MLKPSLSLTAVMLGLVTLCGCGGSAPGGGSNASGASGSSSSPGSSGTTGANTPGLKITDQENNASEVGTTKTEDAAVQAFVASATTSDPASSSAYRSASIDHLDLTRAVNKDWVVTIGSLENADGTAMFPNLSGSFTVTATGTAVTSWPTGVDVQANGTLTVAFDQGAVVYTDPANGLTATITDGTYTVSFIADYTETTPRNWTLALDHALAISPSSALSWTVVPAGGISHAITLSGYRHVNLSEARVFTAGTTNTLAITRTIDGSPLPGSSTPDGVTVPAYTADPAQLFTNWVHTNNGDTSIWNRIYKASVSYDLKAPISKTVTPKLEDIYITEGGVVTGPYTSLSAAEKFLITTSD